MTFENNNFADTETTYAFQPPRTNFSPTSVDISNNWWNTTSTTELDTLMYDWNDDILYRVVDYTPYLTTPSTTAPPSPPSSVAAQTGPTSIAFSWTANPESDITGYKLHYDTDATGYPYANSVDMGDVTSHTLSSLTNGATYYSAISAYDGDGNESWVSEGITSIVEIILIFTTQPGGDRVGSPLSPQPVVAIKNSEGQTLTSSTAPVTLSITDGTGASADGIYGANLDGTTTVNAVNGVATFTNLSIDKLGSHFTITATSPDVTDAISVSISTLAISTAAPSIGNTTLWVLFLSFTILFSVMLVRKQRLAQRRIQG